MILKIVVCVLSVSAVIAGPAQDFFEEKPDELSNALGKVWGAQCSSNSDCADLVAYCDRDHGFTDLDGECRLVWWIWLIAALFVLFIVISCLGCICLPCCCLYNICSNIIDCLCCCCSTKRGYQVARS